MTKIVPLTGNPAQFQMGGIITDAPPKLCADEIYRYVNAARDAHKAGIKFFSIGCSSLDVAGECALSMITGQNLKLILTNLELPMSVLVIDTNTAAVGAYSSVKMLVCPTNTISGTRYEMVIKPQRVETAEARGKVTSQIAKEPGPIR